MSPKLGLGPGLGLGLGPGLGLVLGLGLGLGLGLPGPGPGLAWHGLGWGWGWVGWPPPKKFQEKKTASLKKGNMTRGVPQKSKFIIIFFGDASRHIAFFSKLAIFFLELFLGGHPSHPPPPPAQARPAQAKAQAKAQTQAQAKAQAHRPRPRALGRPGAALGRALGRALVGGARQIPISWPAP